MSSEVPIHSLESGDKKLDSNSNMEPMQIAGAKDENASNSSNSVCADFLSWFKLFKHVDDADNKAEKLSYIDLFILFLGFGIRAFGGPVAQIEMMRSELVDEKKWTTNDRFYRAMSVYQVLPGPEATEMACYFGYLSRGRIGSLIGGMGFIIPGVLLMLLWSYIYVTFGIKSTIVQSSFHCVQIIVAAFIFRATFKLSEGALMDNVPDPKDKTKKNQRF